MLCRKEVCWNDDIVILHFRHWLQRECHFDNFLCSQLQKFRQNVIPVSVYPQLAYSLRVIVLLSRSIAYVHLSSIVYDFLNTISLYWSAMRKAVPFGDVIIRYILVITLTVHCQVQSIETEMLSCWWGFHWDWYWDWMLSFDKFRCSQWWILRKYDDISVSVKKTSQMDAIKHPISYLSYNKCIALLWRHNGRNGVSNHQPHDCLLKRSFSMFRCRSKKTSKLRVAGLCATNSPMTGEFPAQMASNAENVSIWWRHRVVYFLSSRWRWRGRPASYTRGYPK